MISKTYIDTQTTSCYSFPCIPNPTLAYQVALLTPSKSSHPRPLPSRQKASPVSPLDATPTKTEGGDAMGVPLVVPQYRYVASTYLLCFSVLRKHRGCGGILPILELQSLSRAPAQRCALCGDDAGSAWRCSGKSLRRASRCKSPALPCPRCPPAPFRPCGFPAETL